MTSLQGSPNSAPRHKYIFASAPLCKPFALLHVPGECEELCRKHKDGVGGEGGWNGRSK